MRLPLFAYNRIANVVYRLCPDITLSDQIFSDLEYAANSLMHSNQEIKQFLSIQSPEPLPCPIQHHHKCVNSYSAPTLRKIILTMFPQIHFTENILDDLDTACQHLIDCNYQLQQFEQDHVNIPSPPPLPGTKLSPNNSNSNLNINDDSQSLNHLVRSPRIQPNIDNSGLSSSSSSSSNSLISATPSVFESSFQYAPDPTLFFNQMSNRFIPLRRTPPRNQRNEGQLFINEVYESVDSPPQNQNQLDQLNIPVSTTQTTAEEQRFTEEDVQELANNFQISIDTAKTYLFHCNFDPDPYSSAAMLIRMQFGL